MLVTETVNVTCFFFFSLCYTDLLNQTFSAGRANSCDYCFSAPKVPQKLLLQLSKVHFTITRDLSDSCNPAYLEVIIISLHLSQTHCKIKRFFFFRFYFILGLFTKRNVFESRKNWQKKSKNFKK